TIERPVAADELDNLADLPPGLDQNRLDDVVRSAFSEPDPDHLRRTRAVAVIYKQRLIAERYADPLTKDTPLPGWSMTKGVVNALLGVLVNEGKVSLRDPAAIPQWQG